MSDPGSPSDILRVLQEYDSSEVLQADHERISDAFISDVCGAVQTPVKASGVHERHATHATCPHCGRTTSSGTKCAKTGFYHDMIFSGWYANDFRTEVYSSVQPTPEQPTRDEE